MKIDEMLDSVSELASSDEYHSYINKIRTNVNQNNSWFASASLEPNLISDSGISQIPGLKLSPRLFEPENSSTTEFDRVGFEQLNNSDGSTAITICGSVGFVVCASVGGNVDAAQPGTIEGTGNDGIKIPDFPGNIDPVQPDETNFPENFPIPAIEKYTKEFIADQFAIIKADTEKPKFKKMIEDLYETPADEQFSFVKNEVLGKSKLAARGINLSDGNVIMRSAFADGRPTLFAIVRKLPDGKKLTITYDQDS